MTGKKQTEALTWLCFISLEKNCIPPYIVYPVQSCINESNIQQWQPQKIMIFFQTQCYTEVACPEVTVICPMWRRLEKLLLRVLM